MLPAVQELTRRILGGFKPPPKLRLSEYADQPATVDGGAVMTGNAAEKGQWRTLPYQRPILDAFTNPNVETVVCLKSARVGWTKMLGVVVQYYSHHDPCPIMIVQPVKEDAEGYSKEEIKPLFEDTPALQGLITESKARNTSSNTILLKQLSNGGLIDIVNAASGRAFRRKSRKIVLFDEFDAYRRIDEGDVYKLGRNRADYYWDRKIGVGSTPIFKDGRTEELYKKSDQRKFFVPCPFCNHYQVLRWDQMIKEGEFTAHYECENCKKPIPHSKKRWMVERCEDRPTAVAQAPGLIGFHVWAAYSYSPAADWAVLVREYKEALEALRKGDPEPMQTFRNTVLGEGWEDSQAGKVSADNLAKRRQSTELGNGYSILGEDFTLTGVPNGVLLITAGVDTQGGGGTANERLVATVWGWGVGEEGWHLGHWDIDGDPQDKNTLAQLDRIAETKWVRDDGTVLRLARGGIDEGGDATSCQAVREFCSTRKDTWVPVRGAPQKGKPLLGRGVPVSINRKNKPIVKNGVNLFFVGYDESVKSLQYRLGVETVGPGYLHFGLCSTDQFLAELFPWRRMPRRSRGQISYHWEAPTGARDEGGDCTRYAYAVLQLVTRRYTPGTMWAQLARTLGTQAPGTGGGGAAPAPIRRKTSSFWQQV
jgi:phage terminase large subunit GpA-like protein